MAITNHERVGKALELLKAGLGPFVEREMKSVYENKAQAKAAGERLIAGHGTGGTYIHFKHGKVTLCGHRIAFDFTGQPKTRRGRPRTSTLCPLCANKRMLLARQAYVPVDEEVEQE